MLIAQPVRTGTNLHLSCTDHYKMGAIEARVSHLARRGQSLPAKGGSMKATEEHLEFLDDLRLSGAVNMFFAAPLLAEEFPGLSRKDCHEILGYWMETFSERRNPEPPR